jgi:hypothetical protein
MKKVYLVNLLLHSFILFILLTFDFQVNENSIGSNPNQHNPAISADGNGDFCITWSDESYPSGDIYAQRYSNDGTGLGSNFRVNDDQSNTGQHHHPSISADSSGNFIIAWEDTRNDNWDIYAQRYSSHGIAIDSNFIVNDDKGRRWQTDPSISVDRHGNFIIMWIDERTIDMIGDIYAQRYSSDGTALGSNFQVNDDQGTATYSFPSISADESGNFIITWGKYDLDNYDIYAQRYESDGTPLGINFKVNDDQGSTVQRAPAITIDVSGNFIITWQDERNGNDYDIYAQLYSSDGSTLGSNFQVNDDQGSENQYTPSISAESSGNFIITWRDERNSVDGDIYAQRYLSDGTALESNFRVTNTSEGGQRWPDVKLMNNKIYSTWQDNRTSGIEYDIWANVLDWNDPGGTSVNEQYQIPSAFVLYQNYPNPFNPSTTIEFTLPKSEFVELKIYNILGKEVSTLVSNKLNQGSHTYQFDGKNLASGVYYYQLVAGNFHQVKKMILIK